VRFGISRATLRGALQALESVGLINRVSGHGTYVRPYQEWAFLSPVLSRWISAFAPPEPPFLRDIFAFRFSIEPAIAAIAARTACGRDLQAMEEAFAGMVAHAHDPRDRGERVTDFDRVDLAFHQAIYRATGNLIWQQMTPIIEPAIRLVIHRSNAGADQLRATLANHEAMLVHIRRQEPEAARLAAVRQLTRTAEDLGILLEAEAPPPARVLTSSFLP
jgi:DNA-binding FadR family transcriptional regulator